MIFKLRRGTIDLGCVVIQMLMSSGRRGQPVARLNIWTGVPQGRGWSLQNGAAFVRPATAAPHGRVGSTDCLINSGKIPAEQHSSRCSSLVLSFSGGVQNCCCCKLDRLKKLFFFFFFCSILWASSHASICQNSRWRSSSWFHAGFFNGKSVQVLMFEASAESRFTSRCIICRSINTWSSSEVLWSDPDL